MLDELEAKLELPRMAATSEHGGIHAAAAREGSAVAIDLDVHLLMLG